MMNNNKELEMLHQALMKILDEIDRICRKNNINYFLDSGTALGAVRHKGFIPWDDDADVGLIRSEYNRFIEAAKKDLGHEFFLQTRETDRGYLKMSAKIRLNNTYFPEKGNKNKNIHQGIFVDIFPFDFISDNKKKAIRETKKSRLLITLYMLRQNNNVYDSSIRKIFRKIAKVFPEKFLYNLCMNHYLKYDKKKTKTVTCYAYTMNRHHFLHFNLQDMFPSVDINFENKKYMIMNNYDTYLKTMYGDYMKIPPKDKQVVHLNGEIIYGE